MYVELPKISENLNIPCKPFVLRTWAATGLLLCLSTVSQPTGAFILVSARFSVLAVFLTPFSWVCAIIETADVKKQIICIKLCFKLRTAAETHRTLKEAFGEQTLSQARTFEWFKRFKDGRESVYDRKHSGRTTARTTPEMIAEVREVILQDRRQTLHDVCNHAGLSQGNVNAF
jgi:hypothetical protein